MSHAHAQMSQSYTCQRLPILFWTSYPAQAIDVLALHLPNKLILPDALQFAQEAINSPEVHVRAAACTVIVDVAEGCSDALRKKLLPVLQASPCC